MFFRPQAQVEEVASPILETALAAFSSGSGNQRFADQTVAQSMHRCRTPPFAAFPHFFFSGTTEAPFLKRSPPRLSRPQEVLPEIENRARRRCCSEERSISREGRSRPPSRKIPRRFFWRVSKQKPFESWATTGASTHYGTNRSMTLPPPEARVLRYGSEDREVGLSRVGLTPGWFELSLLR